MDDLQRSPALARRLWSVGEPVHAVVYFHPRSIAAWEAVGEPR